MPEPWNGPRITVSADAGTMLPVEVARRVARATIQRVNDMIPPGVMSASDVPDRGYDITPVAVNAVVGWTLTYDTENTPTLVGQAMFHVVGDSENTQPVYVNGPQ